MSNEAALVAASSTHEAASSTENSPKKSPKRVRIEVEEDDVKPIERQIGGRHEAAINAVLPSLVRTLTFSRTYILNSTSL